MMRLTAFSYPLTWFNQKKIQAYIGRNVLVLLYVDDILIVHRDEAAAKQLKDKLKSKYRMTNLGRARRFLGMEIGYETDGTITLCQTTYIDTVLKTPWDAMKAMNGDKTHMKKWLQSMDRCIESGGKDCASLEE
jgi:hypothetical protein